MKKLIAFISGFLLTACVGTSEPATFYTIPTVTTGKAGSDITLSLDVYRVQIPTSVNRPQIVIKNDNGIELIFSETNRWSESLSTMIQSTLVEEIDIALPNALVQGKNFMARAADYALFVEITRLDGVMGKTAVLEAIWTILDSEGAKTEGKGRFETPLKNTYPDYVEAVGQLVNQLSGRITTDIVRAATKHGEKKIPAKKVK